MIAVVVGMIMGTGLVVLGQLLHHLWWCARMEREYRREFGKDRSPYRTWSLRWVWESFR